MWFTGKPYGNLTSLAVGPDGLIYFASMPFSVTVTNNTIYRITYTDPETPSGIVAD